MKVSRSALFDF